MDIFVLKDHVHVQAISRAMGINLEVAYLDGRLRPSPSSDLTSSTTSLKDKGKGRAIDTDENPFEDPALETAPVEFHKFQGGFGNDEGGGEREEGDEEVGVVLLYR